jgi:glycosyltransferase involved in cell wall biosynthesis
MKVSFIITYYNQEKYVNDSISSVIHQKGDFDYEILIGDDGSSDNTVEEIKKWQARYPDKINYFVMERDVNIKYNPIHRASAQRVFLLRKAQGEYFCILDGDDYYSNTDFIVDALAVLENNKILSGCAFNFEYVYSDRTVKHEQNMAEGLFKSKKYIQEDYYIHSGAFLFRNCLTKKNIDAVDKSKNFDDNLISIYMLQFGDFYYINKVIYSYRQSAGSIWNSASQTEKNLVNAMDIEIISRVAPGFKTQIYVRNFGAFKSIYKNRQSIHKLLSEEKIKKYTQENKQLKNKILYAILAWNDQNLFVKVKLHLFYVWVNIVSIIVRRRYMNIFKKLNLIKIIKRRIKKYIDEQISEIDFLRKSLYLQSRESIKLRKKIKLLNKEKINLVFVCYRPQVWGSLKTVFQACNNDGDINVTIVAIPNKKQLPQLDFSHEIYETEGAEDFFKDYPCRVINGYNYETREWFDLRQLEPDYLFFQTPYNTCRPPEYHSKIVSNYTTICYVHYAIAFAAGTFEATCPSDFFGTIDMLFCESEYNKQLYCNLKSTKSDMEMHVTGFPRFDNLENYQNSESSIWNFKRDEKKCRIIWTPRWSTSENDCNFFEYKDKFLEYADIHNDIDFIFRPHPQTFLEFVAQGEMSENEVSEYKAEYVKRKNTKIDFMKEYLEQFYSSDVLVTDVSTIIVEYFLTGKPIIYCHKTDIFNDFSRKLSEGFYWAYNWADVEKYLGMIKSGNDPLKEKRMSLINSEYYIPANGTGNIIKDIIKQDFYKN